ncbi:MAG: carboxypeptidase regulatory-like domain-containing protein, partial [Candidatus Aenigmatarchaeota archaeon]
PNGSWNDDPYSTALALRALYLSENKPLPPPPPTTGSVMGKVVDASTNQPLSGVSVVSGQLSATTTDTGEFTLSGVPAGSQTVTFTLSGYATATATVNITAGSIINLGTIPLSPSPTTGIIKGTVTDAGNGQPLSDVTITVTGSFTGSTVTGTDGTFIFTNVTPGTVTLTASKTGYYSVTGTGTVVVGGILFFNPQLSTSPPTQTTGNLTGKVFDSSTNRPIQGAVISISGGPSGSTDSQGVFLIKDITQGTYQVTISASGYISQLYQVMILAGVTTDMQIIYLTPSPQTTTVTGKVTDAQTGNPVVGAEIVVVGTNLSAKADSTGTYTITGVNLLEFSLKASATGYDSFTYNVKTTTYGTYTINFALNPSKVSDLRITSLSTDKQSYSAYEKVIITATIENHGNTEIHGLVLAQVQDINDNVIALIAPSDPHIILSPLSSTHTIIQWNTAQFSPGNYSIRLMVTDPQTVSRQNPTGDVFTERATVITITSSSSIGGYISLNPPVTQADMQTPVAITTAVRNTGNIPISTTLRLEISFNGNVVYTKDSIITNLQVNNIQELDFESFTPLEGGNYPITLKPLDPSITSNISATLYVGPHATATFTVTPNKVFPGDVKVKGNIHITGAGAATGTSQDPLVPLIKQAIQRGINYEQPAVMSWHNAKRCYGCHIQTQALYGLETSRKRAVIDENVTRTLFDALKEWQKPDGSVGSHYSWYLTQTQLALWAYTSWHDENEAMRYILKSADYLLNRQAANGSWSCDHCSGWWGLSVSATAITMIGISEAYALSNDPKYLTSITKAAQYLLTPNLVPSNNNMRRAHQVIGLEAALSVIADQTLRDQIANAINIAISQLKSVQRSDGGWGMTTSHVSDSLVTAQVLYAMAKANVNQEDPSLRNATIFLLNNQAADGSWYSQNGIMSTRLATTTWVIISLPIAFERIGGIDTDLYLTFPENVTLDSSVPIPSDYNGGNYHWKILGVMEEGKDVNLDLSLKSLLLGEERKIAQSATLTFTNTYTKETVTIPIEIPTVTGIASVSIDLTTDKVEYTANENVTITSVITNISSKVKNPSVRITIEGLQGNLVAQVVEFPVNNLNPSTPQTYTHTWNTGTTLSGNYLVRAELYEDGAFLTEDTANFTILADKTLTSKVTTDKISYNTNEQVTITSQIQSLSPNYIFGNLVAKISIVNPQGQTLFTDEKTIPILTPGHLTELKTYWNTSTNPKGTYTVILKVFEGAVVLSTSTTTFEILGSSETGEGLKGTIAASPNPVYQGRDETITYSVTNSGNEDIPDLTVTILIVDPEAQEIKAAFSYQQSAMKGEMITGIQVISTINLASGIYLAILQAQTSQMSEPKTLASTTFEVKPAIEATKEIPDVKNILVWLDYPWQSGQDIPDRALIEKALNEAGVNYHIVLDKKDFETELRNPYYTDFMILGNHNPIEDHFSEELREQIYAGKGLISSMFNRQNLNADVFGIKFIGYLSNKDYPIELRESEIAQPGVLQSHGRALKVEAGAENTLGWIIETTNKGTAKHPGIVRKVYGNGKILFYAFDLGMSSTNYSQFAPLLKNSLDYVHKPIVMPHIPSQLVPVEIKIKSLGGSFDLRITEIYPEEIKIYDPSMGQWITENPWIINIHLEPEEAKTILYYALTPDKAGTYTLQTEVGYIENDIYNFYQSLRSDIVVKKDTVTISGDIISALSVLSVSGEEKAKVDNAITHIQNVRDRVITTDTDIEQHIHDILKAIDSLSCITSVDISGIRLMMDELLMAWESIYYLLSSEG